MDTNNTRSDTNAGGRPVATNRRRALRRTDLFLVRMWVEDALDGSKKAGWHGKVQRVVDGEAHQFDTWQELVNALQAMLPEADHAE